MHANGLHVRAGYTPALVKLSESVPRLDCSFPHSPGRCGDSFVSLDVQADLGLGSRAQQFAESAALTDGRALRSWDGAPAADALHGVRPRHDDAGRRGGALHGLRPPHRRRAQPPGAQQVAHRQVQGLPPQDQGTILLATPLRSGPQDGTEFGPAFGGAWGM